jgi:hypothetical protein
MAIITSANVASAIVKLVAADALPALVGNLVMGNLVNRDYEPVLAQAGDTVNIPIPPVLVANNIAEGGTVQTQNPNLGNAQIVLNTHAEATFQIPDVTKASGVTSKPAIEGHFKTGQRNIILDEPVLPYRMAVWQPQSDPIRPLSSDHQPGILQNLIPVFSSFCRKLSFES